MFRFAEKKDYTTLIHLFHMCFQDPIPEIRNFMDFFLKQENFRIGVCQKDQYPVSMACLIPATCCGKKAYYVYGVCTHPDYRNQGLSAGLMDYLKKYAHIQGISCLFLVPATKELEFFYEKQGFLCFPAEKKLLTKDSLSTEKDLTLPSYTCRNIDTASYLTLRKGFETNSNVISFNKVITRFTLEQRDPDVHLLEIRSPGLSAPLGIIIHVPKIMYSKKKEATLLEVTSWKQDDLFLCTKILTDYFSNFSLKPGGTIAPVKLSCHLGSTLCIFPLEEDSLPKNPYFSFSMNEIL